MFADCVVRFALPLALPGGVLNNASVAIETWCRSAGAEIRIEPRILPKIALTARSSL
jgi:hypothetical protein